MNADLNVQLFEGDVILTREQQLTMEASSNPNDPFAPTHAVVNTVSSQWPNATVYYVYDDSITGKHLLMKLFS